MMPLGGIGNAAGQLFFFFLSRRFVDLTCDLIVINAAFKQISVLPRIVRRFDYVFHSSSPGGGSIDTTSFGGHACP